MCSSSDCDSRMESDLFDEWADEDSYESNNEEDWYVDLWICLYFFKEKFNWLLCLHCKKICFWVNIYRTLSSRSLNLISLSIFFNFSWWKIDINEGESLNFMLIGSFFFQLFNFGGLSHQNKIKKLRPKYKCSIHNF